MTKLKGEKSGACAIQQALRMCFGATYSEIAKIMDVSQRTVWNHCNVATTCLPWVDRSNECRSEAIHKALKLFGARKSRSFLKIRKELIGR